MSVFQQLCRASGIPEPVAEYKFHPDRKWKIDFAFVNEKLALEVEGGVWTNGRHTRGSGYVKDLDKYNAMASMGWRLLRVMPKQLHTVETINLIKKSLHK